MNKLNMAQFSTTDKVVIWKQLVKSCVRRRMNRAKSERRSLTATCRRRK